MTDPVRAPDAANPDYTLYAEWRSAASFRVRVALHMKGLQAEERRIDLGAGEQHGPAYRALSPLGGLPTLVPAGHAPITQSMAILEFLEESHPAPALLPNDRHGRARVRSLAGMIASDTHPLITPRIRQYMGQHMAQTMPIDDAAWRAWQTHWFGTGLRAVEQRLASEADTGAFCHGDAVTMADICLASVLAVMGVLRIDIGGLPTIERIVARCHTLDAFARAQPARQVGAPAAG
jgi:maleylacetoacetate isomerase